MLVDLGYKLATTFRIKIGGLEADNGKPHWRPKRSARQGMTPEKNPEHFWQRGEKWDHIKICKNQRDAANNFIVADDIQKKIEKKHGELPRIIDIMFFSNNREDVYNDWRAYYRGKKCQCRSDDGIVAYWNTELAQVGGNLEKIGDPAKYYQKLIKSGELPESFEIKIPTLRYKHAAIACPQEQCPFTKNETCKINLILRCMLADAPAIGGAAEFRSTSIHSALQIRASLNQLAGLTKGNWAGIPLQFKLEPKSTDKGLIHIVHIEHPEGMIKLLETAAETRQKLIAFDESLTQSISVKYHEETEEEIEGVRREFYESKGDDVIDVEPGEVKEKSSDPLDALFDANEQAQTEREQKPEKAEQETEKPTHTSSMLCPRDGDSVDPELYCAEKCEECESCDAFAQWQRSTKTKPESEPTEEKAVSEKPDLF